MKSLSKPVEAVSCSWHNWSRTPNKVSSGSTSQYQSPSASYLTIHLSLFISISSIFPPTHLLLSSYVLPFLLPLSFVLLFHHCLSTFSLFPSNSTQGKIKVHEQHAYRLLQIRLISSGPFTSGPLSNTFVNTASSLSERYLRQEYRCCPLSARPHPWAANSMRKAALGVSSPKQDEHGNLLCFLHFFPSCV